MPRASRPLCKSASGKEITSSPSSASTHRTGRPKRSDVLPQRMDLGKESEEISSGSAPAKAGPAGASGSFTTANTYSPCSVCFVIKSCAVKPYRFANPSAAFVG